MRDELNNDPMSRGYADLTGTLRAEGIERVSWERPRGEQEVRL